MSQASPTEERVQQGPGDWLLLLVAGATGAGVLILELMGVRLAAPWFGQSQLVWTNVIGVVLAALAVGQWMGGRWAEAGRGPAPSTLLLAAGTVAMVLPNLVAWLGSRLLPADLELLQAHDFVVLGSLVVSLLGLGLPMLALGAVTPWLVRLSAEAKHAPGRVTGRLLAAGTVGSLVGTFGASHALLPMWGSEGAVRVAGGLLIVSGVLLWAKTSRRRGAAAWLLVPMLGSLIPGAEPRPGSLAEVETAYQWARVIELPDGMRALQLNEGLDSYHSLWPESGLLTGAYYDAFLFPALAAPVGRDGVPNICIVGLAAGTMARQILGFLPESRVRGVEIDEDLVELGRVWFGLPEAVEVIADVDGRVALATSMSTYGAILVDAYAQQIYLPPHLSTREFFQLVHSRLDPGGVVALNVGGLSVEDPVVAAVGSTLATVFEHVQAGRVPGSRNMLLLGWRDSVPDEQLRATWIHDAGLSETLGWLLNPDMFGEWPGHAGRVLVDGHAPLEALAHAAWNGEYVPTTETVVPLASEDALELGRKWFRLTRWSASEALLMPLLNAPDASVRAEAGLVLGNIAYERGQLEASGQLWADAVAESSLDPLVRSALAGNLDFFETEQAKASHLDEARQQFRLLSLGLFGVLLVLVVGLNFMQRRA